VHWKELALAEITLIVNGTEHRLDVEPRRVLGDVLREELGLTGTHLGCEHGVCGACTVVIDGRAVRACLQFAVQADATSITTIEGLATHGVLTPVQQAMADHHGLQCGFCTPGFVMSITALLADNADPTEDEIREGLSGNLCRCTGYQGIIRAVRQAAATQADLMTVWTGPPSGDGSGDGSP
jgi:aerobic carbon-monoxide dehydrogenase small subunit